jgi:hypothetical protein
MTDDIGLTLLLVLDKAVVATSDHFNNPESQPAGSTVQLEDELVFKGKRCHGLKSWVGGSFRLTQPL